MIYSYRYRVYMRNVGLELYRKPDCFKDKWRRRYTKKKKKRKKNVITYQWQPASRWHTLFGDILKKKTEANSDEMSSEESMHRIRNYFCTIWMSTVDAEPMLLKYLSKWAGAKVWPVPLLNMLNGRKWTGIMEIIDVKVYKLGQVVQSTVCLMSS